MTTTKHLPLIIVLLICTFSTISAQTSEDKNTDPIKPYFYNIDSDDTSPTLYVNNGLFHSTEIMFADSIAFDDNLRAFIMQDGVVRGATTPKLVYTGYESIMYFSTTLQCTFDFLRLPTGNYTLVIPAGSVWWKNNPEIKNDIISCSLCVPDSLIVLESTPANGSTIKTLTQFKVRFHCRITEKTTPSATLYEGDKIIERFPMKTYGYGPYAYADFGKTLHFKKNVQYNFVINPNAFQSDPDLEDVHLSNKEIRITFTGGE